MMNSVKQWFMMLNQREKILVTGGAIIATLILLWAFVWEPLVNTREKLEIQLTKRQNELRWMQYSSQKIREHQRNGQTPIKAAHRGNLSGIIERTLNQYNLKWEKMQGQKNVKLRLKGVNADKFMYFVGKLESQHHLLIKKLELIPREEKGKIDASLTIGSK
jgi:type II secretory pathway component PulM